MEIEKILKQLTPEYIKTSIFAIDAINLPVQLQNWVERYNKIGERNEFIWKSLYAFAQYYTLPNVIEKYQESVYEVKIIGMIFIALADDLADKHKHRNRELLDKLLKIPFNQNFKINSRFSLNQLRYLKFAQQIWKFLQQKIQKYPCYKKFESLFEFDYQQVFNSIKYGYLINSNFYLANFKESSIYLPYNMQIFVNSDIDLMCFPEFEMRELKTLREIVWNVQMMARIANCLATWERELEEKDFSSLIFTYATRNNIITSEELRKNDKEKIRKKIKSSNYQKYFLTIWKKYYKEAKNMGKKLKSIDIIKYLKGSEEVLKGYMITKGLI